MSHLYREPAIDASYQISVHLENWFQRRSIDWLYAACLEYFIFFSIDSSEARKQYDEYCLLV
jgi:hypothetical protein